MYFLHPLDVRLRSGRLLSPWQLEADQIFAASLDVGPPLGEKSPE